MRRLKYDAALELAAPLGRLLLHRDRIRVDHRGRAWDCLVGVPPHRLRTWLRGFDHVESILRAAATEAREPLPPHRRWLARVRFTRPQVGLSPGARRANVARAFAGRPGAPIAGRRILVVDDVTTTGATLAACRSALLAAGAAEVGTLALLGPLA